MCGIVGYIGARAALPIVLDGLQKLEYRGYDSAGIAVLQGDSVQVIKCAGRIAILADRLDPALAHSQAGIGHTRWATHGPPTDANAHPHTDCTGRLAVVHNGIIENYLELRRWLEERGHVFTSQTDTEVVPHLIEHHLQHEHPGDLVAAVRAAVARLKGAYALAVLSNDDPERLVAVRLASPLVVGVGEGENILASDIPAILSHTRRALVLDDNELAVITRTGVRVERLDGAPVTKEPLLITWAAAEAEKGGYAHFMLKEIHDQPAAIRDSLRGRLDAAAGRVLLGEETGLDAAAAAAVRKVAIVACGTAAHAGLVGRQMIEGLARVPVEWELASEYRYRDPLVAPGTLCVAVSQSGETADTLAALREARARGARTLAISNVVGSTLTREAEATLYTWAGPEIAVASTKAYTTQVVVLALLAMYLAQERGRLAADAAAQLIDALQALPAQVQTLLDDGEGQAAALAERLADRPDVFYIGRGLDYAAAVEGQLKLKEISYIHAEAYAAGELKHGTLALVQPGVPVIAVATQEHLHDKTLSNIQEVRARGAEVIAIALQGDAAIEHHADHVLRVPRTHPLLAPVLAAVPMQLLAYYVAVARGTDVDKPRNLAKSVTVE